MPILKLSVYCGPLVAFQWKSTLSDKSDIIHICIYAFHLIQSDLESIKRYTINQYVCTLRVLLISTELQQHLSHYIWCAEF